MGLTVLLSVATARVESIHKGSLTSSRTARERGDVMSLIIAHSAAEGTVVWGTSRGDGSAEILKTHRWRWGRSLGAWYLPRTRDQRPNQVCIEQTAQALREAGFPVELDIDDRTRGAAAVEADRIARQQQRTHQLQEQADRAAVAADGAWNAADAAAGKLPPMGEPIKIGHPSEHRHRRAAERAQAALAAALDAHQQAEEAQHRAETATHTTGARYNPITVANRIDKLEADARALQRHLDGYRHPVNGQAVGDTAAPAAGGRREQLTDQLAQIHDQLAYWRQVRADQVATGEATHHSSSTINPGDLVEVSRRWFRVIRANPRTVSVATNTGRHTTPYSHITNHQPNPDSPTRY